MDLVAAVGADEEAATVVEPCEGAFNHPTLSPQPGAVLGLAARDHRLDAALPDQAPILVVVVAAVGDERPRAVTWPTDSTPNSRDAVEQFDELRDVVAVAAGECPSERSAAAVYKQVVLTSCATAVNGTGADLAAPFFACRWLESAIACSHSS